MNAPCTNPPTGKYRINSFHLDAAWLRFLLLLRTYLPLISRGAVG
jgi:hypothetical protein